MASYERAASCARAARERASAGMSGAGQVIRDGEIAYLIVARTVMTEVPDAFGP